VSYVFWCDTNTFSASIRRSSIYTRNNKTYKNIIITIKKKHNNWEVLCIKLLSKTLDVRIFVDLKLQYENLCWSDATVWESLLIWCYSMRIFVDLMLQYDNLCWSNVTVWESLLIWCYSMRIFVDQMLQYENLCWSDVTVWESLLI
jgi:hypothetical protein